MGSVETPKQWILNAFAMQAPGHLNPGLWRCPNDKGSIYNDIQHWIGLAKKLEAAKFHAIFFADVLGGYDVYKGPANLHPTIPAASQFPINDPLYSVTALAAATECIGFGVTSSTTYESPYALARKFSTVDHLSNGRVGWNIVTSYLDSAARNFGLDTQIPHDTRYEIANEYMDVCYKLWEGSWRDDAVEKSKERYANPDAVRQIDHVGKHFNVPGPHLCEPSRQRTPFIFQAGTSGAGRAFAARHAEAVFLNAHSPELTRPSVDSIRAQAVAEGRLASDIKVVAGLLVIVAPTDELAKAKYEDLSQYGDREGALALFGGWSGIDLSTYSDEEDFRFVKLPAVQSMVNHWSKTVPGKSNTPWNKKAIADHLIMGGNGAKLIGSPKTVADELQRWIDVADVDGFNLSYATLPGTFDDIIELLIPELRKRGVFWEDYAVPGGTLRENYYSIKDQSRLPERHHGSQFKWKAGEVQAAFLNSSYSSKKRSIDEI